MDIVLVDNMVDFSVEDLNKLTIQVPSTGNNIATSAKITSGKIIPPKQHIFLLSADEWEEFIAEWAQFQKSKYKFVTNLGGACDYGIDVACFYTSNGFLGEWDNYQCKYYKGTSLTPSIALPEVGKILWHCFQGKITKPKNYYFFAPKDCGPSLKKLLLDSSKLKNKLFEQWDVSCANYITTKQITNLDGKFRDYVDNFDFSIFQYLPTATVIEDHRLTPYFAIRFGGGLPDRPTPMAPPKKAEKYETRYLEQLIDAYSEHLNVDNKNFKFDLDSGVERHYNRQREAFYYAEALKGFARDNVPVGTFEELQDDVEFGVIDICEADHINAFKRINEVTSKSSSLALDSNGLFQVIRIKDRHGICHQLANEDRLVWKK